MTVHFNIIKALADSVTALTIPELVAIPIEQPNMVLSSYPDLWLKLSIVPAEAFPVTLGINGDDNHNGYLQIDVNVPVNTGDGLVNLVAGKIKREYPAGRNIGQVVVGSSSVSPARVVGAFYRVSVTVSYYSRIARSA